jgi:crotonobetaine/carnitine-CoA ligase
VNADGGYTFAGRKKELLRRRGENVSPLEVEQALAEHPAVQDVAVVGVPSDLSEEEIKAFIVPTQGQPLDLAQLRAWVAERLSAHKVPRFWQILDELPQTATARVAKHRLPVGRQPGEYDAERVHRGRPS